MKPDKFSDIPNWVFEALEDKMGELSYHDYGFLDNIENAKEKVVTVPFAEQDDQGFCKESQYRIRVFFVEFFSTKSVLSVNFQKLAEEKPKLKPNGLKGSEISEKYTAKLASWDDVLKKSIEYDVEERLMGSKKPKFSADPLYTHSSGYFDPITMSRRMIDEEVGIVSMIADELFFKNGMANFNNLDI